MFRISLPDGSFKVVDRIEPVHHLKLVKMHFGPHFVVLSNQDYDDVMEAIQHRCVIVSIADRHIHNNNQEERRAA